MSFDHSLVSFGESIVSRSPLLSVEDVFVLSKRYTTSPLWTLRHSVPVLVEVSRRWHKFSCRTNVFVAAPRLVRRR